jgi:KDO2-lipid IV(A) lauroyltransferase
MGQHFLYHILRAFAWPMQLFPLGFHYFASEILYVVVYLVFGYRKKVVSKNLKNAFPQLSEAELKAIERKFYKNFIDIFIETLYFTHINIEKEKGRLEITNYQLIKDLAAENRNILLVMGHLGNWEFLEFLPKEDSLKYYFVYKKLNNKAFDQFFRDLRGRAATPLEMKQTFRQLYNDTQENKPFLALFISDQRPVKGEIKHWVNFMNQETPVMLGTEKVAQRTGAAVVYFELHRKSRGYHQAHLELICEDASKTAEYEITDAFMQKLEQSIKREPDQYLWTHNRWKFKRADFNPKI